MVPLFLGADLFSNTDIRTENHPRYHAKFAKKGLATKLHFSSGKFLSPDTDHHKASCMVYGYHILFVCNSQLLDSMD